MKVARPSRERLRELGGDRVQEVAVAPVLLGAFLFFRLRIDDFVARARGRTFLAPVVWPGAILVFAIVMRCGVPRAGGPPLARGWRALASHRPPRRGRGGGSEQGGFGRELGRG